METMEEINFTDQFFKREHYEAFNPEKAGNEDYDRERMAVADRLLDLDSILWPEIQLKKWNISHHPMQNHWTSTWQLSQAKAFFENEVKAVWLHYGKSKIELETFKEFQSEESSETFIYHIRLQLVLRNNDFEIALVLGKNKGGRWDRGRYKELMQNPDYRKRIFEMLKNLDDDYWIDFNDSNKMVKEFKTADELFEYTKHDKIESYFTFGKNIQPDNDSISEKNIVQTIMNEFEKLYPLYSMFKYRM